MGRWVEGIVERREARGEREGAMGQWWWRWRGEVMWEVEVCRGGRVGG